MCTEIWHAKNTVVHIGNNGHIGVERKIKMFAHFKIHLRATVTNVDRGCYRELIFASTKIDL